MAIVGSVALGGLYSAIVTAGELGPEYCDAVVASFEG